MAAAWLDAAHDERFASMADHSSPFTPYMFSQETRFRCRVDARAFDGFLDLEARCERQQDVLVEPVEPVDVP